MILRDPKYVILDAVIPELQGHDGYVYGLHEAETTFIVRAEGAAGLNPVATLSFGMCMLPRLTRDGLSVVSEHAEYPVEVMPYASLIGANQLRRRHAAVVGLSRVGASAADALARAGIGRLTLVDPASVTVASLASTGFLLRDVGVAKVFAAARELVRACPRTRIQAIYSTVEGALSDASDLLDDADVVIGAAPPATNAYLAERLRGHVPLFCPGSEGPLTPNERAAVMAAAGAA